MTTCADCDRIVVSGNKVKLVKEIEKMGYATAIRNMSPVIWKVFSDKYEYLRYLGYSPDDAYEKSLVVCLYTHEALRLGILICWNTYVKKEVNQWLNAR